MSLNCLCQYSSEESQDPKLIVVTDKIRGGKARKVLKCETCQLTFLEPIERNLKEYYKKEYRQEYSPTVGKENSPREIFNMYRPFMDERVERVQHLVSKECSVLEIGCATGYFLDALSTHVDNRIGIEYNETHAEFVRSELGIPCYTTPITDTDISKGSIDAVFLFHILEHVEDPVLFLTGIFPYLSEGGKIYIEVPNIDDALLGTYKIRAYEEFFFHDPHLFYFSAETLQSLACTAGFRGGVEMVQRYSLLNHFHWILTNQPMGDANLGMRVSQLFNIRDSQDKSNNALEIRVNNFIREADMQYRELLKEFGKTESIAFTGTKLINPKTE
jgi:2-polyprenyl-3-methyl-5-hydroxy-6-metoxy-1,4-benzoquinol methylase